MAAPIVNALRASVGAHPYVHVQRLHTTPADSAAAQDAGRRYNASIVLWGTYTQTRSGARITSQVELVGDPCVPPRSTAGLDPAQRMNAIVTPSFGIPAVEFRQLTVSAQLRDIAYLTSLAVGLAQYKAGDYTGAADTFVAARQTYNTPVFHFYEGLAQLCAGDHSSAISAFSAVIGYGSGAASRMLESDRTITPSSDMEWDAARGPPLAGRPVAASPALALPAGANAAVADRGFVVGAYCNQALAYNLTDRHSEAINDAAYVINHHDSYLPQDIYANAHAIRADSELALGRNRAAAEDAHRALVILYTDHKGPESRVVARAYGAVVDDLGKAQAARGKVRLAGVATRLAGLLKQYTATRAPSPILAERVQQKEAELKGEPVDGR